MRWFIVLMVLFAILYIFGIFRAVLRLNSLKRLLEKMKANMGPIEKAFENSKVIYGDWEYRDSDEIENFLGHSPCREHLRRLISLKPEIDEFLPFSSPFCRISYNASLLTNYDSLQVSYNDLLMEQNRLLLDIKHSLNPKFTVKNLFLLPSTLLSLVGISFEKTTAANLFSSITWIAGFIIKNYGDAIKTAIGELLLK